MLEQTRENSAVDFPLSASLEKNKELLKQSFELCDDIIFLSSEIEGVGVCFVHFANTANTKALFKNEQSLSSFLVEKQYEESTSLSIRRISIDA